MADELDESGVEAATNRLAYEISHELSDDGPPHHHFHTERMARAVLTEYFAATAASKGDGNG